MTKINEKKKSFLKSLKCVHIDLTQFSDFEHTRGKFYIFLRKNNN